MDLSTSVIIPREDFLELQTAAYNQPPASGKERIGNALQIIVFCSAAAAAVTAASWGWAKAVDWREERAFQRSQRHLNPVPHPEQ